MNITLHTYSKDGYLFFKEKIGADSILGDSLVVNSTNYSQLISYIKEKGIKSIRIIPAYHQVNNLDFLNELKHIQGLYILQRNLDLSVINNLTELRVLRIDDTKSLIDFNNLSKIEVLGITFNKFTINVNKCKKIFWLWLDNYKYENLQYLSELENLQYLNLHKTAIKDLLGIEGMHRLKELNINVANKLESLNGLSINNRNLEFIMIYSAKNLVDYSSIRDVKSIIKIVLSKTGETNSLSFLSSLVNIKEVVIGMKVLDGNMNYLVKIPNASFLEFPHYNLTMKDIKKHNPLNRVE